MMINCLKRVSRDESSADMILCAKPSTRVAHCQEEMKIIEDEIHAQLFLNFDVILKEHKECGIAEVLLRSFLVNTI